VLTPGLDIPVPALLEKWGQCGERDAAADTELEADPIQHAGVGDCEGEGEAGAAGDGGGGVGVYGVGGMVWGGEGVLGGGGGGGSASWGFSNTSNTFVNLNT
jgi:hypothetical protein